jgi:hypothetical protein
LINKVSQQGKKELLNALSRNIFLRACSNDIFIYKGEEIKSMAQKLVITDIKKTCGLEGKGESQRAKHLVATVPSPVFF